MIQVQSAITSWREELPLEIERLMHAVTIFLQTSFGFHVSNIRLIDLLGWNWANVEAYHL